MFAGRGAAPAGPFTRIGHSGGAGPGPGPPTSPCQELADDRWRRSSKQAFASKLAAPEQMVHAKRVPIALRSISIRRAMGRRAVCPLARQVQGNGARDHTGKSAGPGGWIVAANAHLRSGSELALKQARRAIAHRNEGAPKGACRGPSKDRGSIGLRFSARRSPHWGL